MKAIVTFWLYTLLTLWYPPERRSESLLLEARESKEQAQARYLSIAEDAVEVAFMPEEDPVFKLKDEEKGRAWTALLMLSVAYFESGFRRDIDRGIGRLSRGDGGQSWCLMQIHLGEGKVPDADPTVGSWRGRDLVADRKKCFRAGLRMLRRSFTACSGQAFAYRLSSYASGSCDKGHEVSNQRLLFFNRQLKRQLALPEAQGSGLGVRSAP